MDVLICDISNGSFLTCKVVEYEVASNFSLTFVILIYSPASSSNILFASSALSFDTPFRIISGVFLTRYLRF
jgi:hypothetical protein